MLTAWLLRSQRLKLLAIIAKQLGDRRRHLILGAATSDVVDAAAAKFADLSADSIPVKSWAALVKVSGTASTKDDIGSSHHYGKAPPQGKS